MVGMDYVSTHAANAAEEIIRLFAAGIATNDIKYLRRQVETEIRIAIEESIAQYQTDRVIKSISSAQDGLLRIIKEGI